MHVTSGSEALGGGRWSSGFSLAEVIIASSLLLMTITAVTFCVTSASAGGARLQEVMDADRAVRLVAERLAALPFYGPDADAASTLGAPAGDVLGAVFPHANAAWNTPAARYVSTDEGAAPAGSFVTVFTEGGVDVVCVARFLAAEAGPALEPAAVEGWSLDDGRRPPACALSVWLTATSQGTIRSAGFTLAALATAPIRPAIPAAAT